MLLHYSVTYITEASNFHAGCVFKILVDHFVSVPHALVCLTETHYN